MSDGRSRMYEDIEDYEKLCVKWGEREREVYSEHYYWLELKDRGKTDQTFEQYKIAQSDLRDARRLIEIERDINKLKEEAFKIKSK